MTTAAVALPAGADPEFSDGEWEADIDSPTGYYRCVWSPEFGTDGVRVVATQYRDGTLGTAEHTGAPTPFDVELDFEEKGGTRTTRLRGANIAWGPGSPSR